ncbi:MAG: FAD-binding oxidoreductase [Candidatus Andersenbacteria bacterium]|nr:FAD-binding oxidoreductase [Candidatus Andersenbacteria bacterium]
MPKSLRQKLQPLLAGAITSSREILTRYSRDASLFTVRPQLVAYPKDAHDIRQLVLYANQHPRARLSLTARSGGTDMTGGPLNESIIIDASRHMNRLLSVGPGYAVVQPGLFYRDFEAATLPHNLLLPSYPASREICTVGGMVANNAGGEKSLTYGKTERYITALKAVLRDGREHTFRKLTMAELQQHLKPRTFAGSIYRQVWQLIEQHHDLLQRAKPKVTKNSTGYNLWNVYDAPAQTFDLTQLLVGSQGTLGIITEITFRLVTPKPHTQLLIIFLDDLKELADIVQRTLTYLPESFESFDSHTFKLTARFLPTLVKQLKAKNALSLAWQFLPEITTVLTGGTPALLLLAEFASDSAAEVRLRAQAAAAALRPFKLKTRLASPAEARKYWIMRRESFNLLRHHLHGRRTAPFIDDIVVRPEQLPEFLPRLTQIMSQYNLTYTITGHIGDANFHIIPLMDVSRPDTDDIIEELSAKVYDLVFAFGGSISGEHNDGLVRSHYLEKMYGPEVYRLFAEIKNIFDPDNIFNPGKKVGADWAYAKKHLIRKN